MTETDYRDDTPLTDTEKSSIEGNATAIRQKMYGKDVREAIASGLELVGSNVQEVAQEAVASLHLPGANLLSGATSDWSALTVTNTSFTTVTDVASKTVRFSVDIKNAGTDGQTVENIGFGIRDSSGNLIHPDGTQETDAGSVSVGISWYGGLNGVLDVQQGTQSHLTLAVTLPSTAASITPYIYCSGPWAQVSYSYSSPIFTIGKEEYPYAPSYYDMEPADAIALVLRALDQKVNGLRDAAASLHLPGINLLSGATSDWSALTVTNTSFTTVTDVASKTVRFSVDIKNAGTDGQTAENIGFGIRDSSGNLIHPDGTQETDAGSVSVGISWYGGLNGVLDVQQGTQSHLTLAVTLPSTAASITPYIYCSGPWAQVSYSYSSPIFTIGEEEYPYAPGYYDMEPADAIALVLRALDQKIETGEDKDSQIKIDGLPKLVVSGNYQPMLSANTETVLPYTLYDHDRTMTGYADMKWQGDSTAKLPKKGFKFKTSTDSNGKSKAKWQPLPSFYRNNSFNLKAYYTTKWSMNDAICAEIYSQMIANNETAPDELMKANHFGTIQSRPVLLYFGDIFYGLMEFCTKASSNLWNVDKANASQMAIQGGKNDDQTRWRAANPTLSDTGDFGLDSDNATNAQTALTNLSSKLVGANGEEFKTAVSNIFDINSISDYIIFSYLVNDTDAWDGKNIDYLTYDNGTHWYMMAYDFDATLGQTPTPGDTQKCDYDYFAGQNDGNMLILNFRTNFQDVLLARYNKLVASGVLTAQNLASIVDSKINSIPQGAFEAEWAQWPDCPTYQESQTPDTIKHMLVYRLRMLKKKLTA